MTDDEILEMAESVYCGTYPKSNGVFVTPLNITIFAKLIAKRQRQIDAEIARRFEPDEHLDFADYASTAILKQGESQ